MKPLTPVGSPSPLRLLNKGPEYLRRQIDSGDRGRSVSAVERLEADKAKYVKSQQVINSKQEPVLVPCATPPPQPRRPLTVPCATVPLPPRRPLTVPCSAPLSSLGRTFAPQGDKSEALQDIEAKKENQNLKELKGNTARTTPATPVVQNTPVLRRSSGKRMLRPDSLIIYRQKRECKTSAGGETKGYSFVRRLFQGSMREKSSLESPPKMIINEEKSPSKEEDTRMSWTNDKETPIREQEVSLERDSSKTEAELFVAPDSPRTPRRTMVLEVSQSAISLAGDTGKQTLLRRMGLQRSKSDLRLRYSLALSEKERFFNYCGLDLEVVDRLGLENFFSASSDTVSLMLRSVSAGGSEASEFSRHSGEGLFEEELTEQVPSVVSVIERNARVIKWLYGCRNAKDTPKESTV
ncbi:protein FAM110C [Lepisosteus oculatus]|uniref:Family with sequence similarity 110 member D n=1 Tax=Lepisosteus oculatus TaxID=7918 RepID=W5NMA8_LEPOC|nr:PREDICTED: protein FAM110C-like [Lepisosteus oculatus]XP_015204601.1 PREDICTED: protein FAM110D [Lepisosteus oculatus]